MLSAFLSYLPLFILSIASTTSLEYGISAIIVLLFRTALSTLTLHLNTIDVSECFNIRKEQGQIEVSFNPIRTQASQQSPRDHPMHDFMLITFCGSYHAFSQQIKLVFFTETICIAGSHYTLHLVETAETGK